MTTQTFLRGSAWGVVPARRFSSVPRSGAARASSLVTALGRGNPTHSTTAAASAGLLSRQQHRHPTIPYSHTGGALPQQQVRCVFVIAERTPNPESQMFYPQAHDVLGKAAKTISVKDKAQAADLKSLLAMSLFKVHGVHTVMLAARHVTVTKQPDIDWDLVQPNVELVLSQFFAAGLDVIDSKNIERYEDDFARRKTEVQESESLADEEMAKKRAGGEKNLEAEIIELLEERVQPFVQQDGGDVAFAKIEDGVLHLHMMGACAGCPKSGITLNLQIKQLVQHYFPEITDVVEFVDPNEELIPRGH